MAELGYGTTIGGNLVLHGGMNYAYIQGQLELGTNIKSPKFEIASPYGINYIAKGTGDGANYSTFNIDIKCWWGIGIRDNTDTVRAYYDARTGTWDVKGGYRVNGVAIPTKADYDILQTDVQNGKNSIATAITNKGVSASGSETFSSLATKISQIEQNIKGVVVDNGLLPSVVWREQWKLTSAHAAGINALCVDSKGYVYTGTRQPDGKVRKFAPDGTLVWTFNPSEPGNTEHQVTKIQVDRQGYVYATTTGPSSSHDKVFKLNPDGTQKWVINPYSFGGPNEAMVVDSQGNVFTRSGSYVIKVNPHGNTMWSYDWYHKYSPVEMDIDNRDNLYVAYYNGGVLRFNAGEQGNPITILGSSDEPCSLKVLGEENTLYIGYIGSIRRYGLSHAGNYSGLLFNYSLFDYNLSGYIVYGIDVDQDSNIYIAKSSDVLKLTNYGRVLAHKKGDSHIKGFAVDKQGNIYTGNDNKVLQKIGQYSSVNPRILNCTRSLSQVWNYAGHTSWIQALAVDCEGYVYSASSDGSVRKIINGSTAAWSITHTPGVAYGVTIDEVGNVYSIGQDGYLKVTSSSNGSSIGSYSLGGNKKRTLKYADDGYLYLIDEDRYLYKYSKQGVLQWNTYLGAANVYSVDFAVSKRQESTSFNDSNAFKTYVAFNVYSSSQGGATGFTNIYDEAGRLFLRINHGANWPSKSAFDYQGNLYVHETSPSSILRKYTLQGIEIWNFQVGTGFNLSTNIEVDTNNNVYIVGETTIIILNGDGQASDANFILLNRKITPGSQNSSIAIDGLGNIYLGGYRYVHKIKQIYNTSDKVVLYSRVGPSISTLDGDYITTTAAGTRLSELSSLKGYETFSTVIVGQ